jgi:sirohydrochlorin cobaltochelatase
LALASEPGATVVLVGGHESNNGADLSFVAQSLPDVFVTPPGRPLHNLLTQLCERNGEGGGGVSAPVIVLPMTFGRNPTLVADTAKTLRWLAQGSGSGTGTAPLALADPFGTGDHLTAWLRAAATEVRRRTPDAAVLIAADAANPFDDAELHRIAHLVRTHGAGNLVETATVDSADGLLDAVRRLRLLGSTESVVVPAGFRRVPHVHGEAVPFGEGSFAGAAFYGPLLSEQALLRVIRERVRDSLHALSHGRTGIDEGLLADHGHGYAHSHAFDEAGGHSHTHSHGTAVPHTHGHPTPISSS